MINVTKTFLPPLEEYIEKLKLIWETSWITNQGPLAEQLEQQLKEYLGVKNLLLVSNGTIALQIAIKALDLSGEIITTPYSYVATTTSILWENCVPVFCDIEAGSFCINADLIEKAITPKTSAILPTHVYGFPCDIKKIKDLGEKYNLKVIYDGAHAFNVKIDNNSIFNFGDIATVSFHATKLFHTVEGGAIITNDDKLAEKIYLYRAFGHLDDNYYTIGINGRTSELNAAMGICNLSRVEDFIKHRRALNELYRSLLDNSPVQFPQIPGNIDYNYSYFPVFFPSEDKMLITKNFLLEKGINTRRYFYPSLNKLPYIEAVNCPVSENIAGKVLCLPLYHELTFEQVREICSLVSESFYLYNR